MFLAYKKPLDKTIDSETDGDLGKLLLEILKVSNINIRSGLQSCMVHMQKKLTKALVKEDDDKIKVDLSLTGK